ncbi:MAG: hypothetical protein KatS3mg035_1990 [Bacteroidia bacterium]|nr:MAG: hypothetical protein KatS3mg035_1990 [Bacteroidia bacterium]
MHEGYEGHEVALPFDAFEKSGKRIAAANSEARSTPTRMQCMRDMPQLSVKKNIH